MESIKLGYVGCGFMAQKVHIPNFASLPACELIGLAEVRTDLGRNVQRRWEIPRLYADHTELAADPDIEAAAVSADFALQGEIAKDLLSAGENGLYGEAHGCLSPAGGVNPRRRECRREKTDGRLHETVRRGQRTGEV